MRILLLSMPEMVLAFRGCLPPNLAISSITRNPRGHDFQMADLILVRNNLTSYIKKLLIEYKPEVIGFNAMSFQFNTVRCIATVIRSLDIDIKTVTGGYHATLIYREISG